MKWRNKNFGKSPFDPDYDDRYDAEEDYNRYIDEMELRYELERDNESDD